MNWSLQKVLVIGGIAWLVLAPLAIEPIARLTVLRQFYADVATASEYSSELTFDHPVLRTLSSEGMQGTNSRRNGFHFDNCSSAGTFTNYVTNKTIHGAFTCSRNFISYYGMDAINVQAVDNVTKEIASLGWVDSYGESTSDEKFRAIQDQTDGTVRGLSFKRGDGLNASVIFLSRDSEDYRAYCRNLSDNCRALERKEAKYATLMSVNISAYKGYEDDVYYNH